MKAKHVVAAALLIMVVMCTGWALWYARPYMPAVARELAVCGMILVAVGTLAIIYMAAMGALALWHWQVGRHHAHTVIAVAEHGSYVRQGDRFVALMPASVHMVALGTQTSVPSPQTTVGALPAPQGTQYPQAPAFAAIQHLIRPGRLILGYNLDGPIYGDVTDLLSMAFVGKPGTGKSSALLYYLAMLLLVNAEVYVFDHQGSLSELADLLPYYGSFEEITAVLPAIDEEIAEREDLWRNGRQVRRPMLVLVDELPAIARWEAKHKPEHSVLDLAEKIVLENRKHQCFCLLTGQSLPAEVLPTLTRDNLSSRLVFNSSAMHARMAGLDQESRKRLLPLLRKAEPGTAILDVSRRPEPDIAALPYTTVDDLREIVDVGSDFRDFPAPGQRPPGTVPASGTSTERDTEAGLRVVTGTLADRGNERERTPEATERDYRLSEAEQTTLLSTYKVCGSIEKTLRSMGKGARYARDASRLLREEGILA